jgi:hypothetical protein
MWHHLGAFDPGDRQRQGDALGPGIDRRPTAVVAEAPTEAMEEHA